MHSTRGSDYLNNIDPGPRASFDLWAVPFDSERGEPVGDRPADARPAAGDQRDPGRQRPGCRPASQLGFLQRTPRGRIATRRAYASVAMLAVLRNWTQPFAAGTARVLFYVRLLGVKSAPGFQNLPEPGEEDPGAFAGVSFKADFYVHSVHGHIVRKPN